MSEEQIKAINKTQEELIEVVTKSINGDQLANDIQMGIAMHYFKLELVKRGIINKGL